MLRGVQDHEILKRNKISVSTLTRYKKIIEERQLDTYKKLSDVKAESIFMAQIERMEDVIRRVNMWIERHPKRNPVGMLRLLLDTCSRICDYQFKVGAIKEVPKEFRHEIENKIVRQSMMLVVSELRRVNPDLASELSMALRNVPELGKNERL